MKTTLKKLGTIKIIFSLLALTIFVSSCKKDWGDSSSTTVAGIGFVHASPGTGALDFIVNNQKANNKDFTYTNDLGYFGVYPGSLLFGVVKKDSTRYLTTSNVTLRSGLFYSAFVIDVLPAPKILVVEDDLKAPETDKAKVRFINLSPDSKPFDLEVHNTDPAALTASFMLTTNKAYKDVISFTSINPSISYKFELKETGSAIPVATISNIKIEKGKIYTIWAKGLKTATDSTKLSLGIITNK